MRAVYATGPNSAEPLRTVTVGERPEPTVPEGWTRVAVRAASLNQHDLWTARGVGIRPDEFPMILGCDGAGVTDDGSAVVIYPVIADPGAPGADGDETLDPDRRLLTEGGHQGCMAEYVAVPERNLVPLPDGLSFEQATVLGTTYLTAYRMLVTRGRIQPGQTMLVQGATGGVATALIQLGVAMGARVWASARTEEGQRRARDLGAELVVGTGSRLPGRVDAVLESVGADTWDHSMKSVKPGGIIVCCGATSGAGPSADLQRLFFRQISVVGSTMGTLEEFRRLIRFVATAGIEPRVDAVYSLADATDAFARLSEGGAGKLVLRI